MRRFALCATVCCFILGLVAGKLSHETSASVSLDSHLDDEIATDTVTPRTLCDRSEQVAFSCVMQISAKVLSICTSKRFDEQNGYLQYRFGQPGKIELEFPAERKNTQSAFGYTRYTRPLVTFLSLRFESNGYKYSIHQDSNAEEKPPVSSSYLDVTPPEENAKPIEMKCRSQVIGSLMLLEDTVPRIEDVDVTSP